MKPRIIVFAILLGSILFLTVQCEKEGLLKNEDSSTQSISDNQLEKTILNFLDFAKEVENGNSPKTTDSISVDSAIIYLDATLNYTYCFTDANYERLIRDTSYVTVDLLSSIWTTQQNAAEAYNDAIDEIKTKYTSITDTTKRLVSVIVLDYGLDTPNKKKLQIISFIGTGSSGASILNSSGKFPIDEEYWFMHDSYSCDLQSTGSGAPNILKNETMLNLRPTPQVNQHIWFTRSEVYTPDIGDDPLLRYKPVYIPDDNYCDYYIFFADEEIGGIGSLECQSYPWNNCARCLDYNQGGSGIHEMDFYLEGTEYVINRWLNDATLNGQDKSFEFIEILGNERIKNGQDFLIIEHLMDIIFGIRHVSYSNNQYPISIE